MKLNLDKNSRASKSVEKLISKREHRDVKINKIALLYDEAEHVLIITYLPHLAFYQFFSALYKYF